MYVWSSAISEEFVEFGIFAILLMVVDSLVGIDYLIAPQIVLVNVAQGYEPM